MRSRKGYNLLIKKFPFMVGGATGGCRLLLQTTALMLVIATTMGMPMLIIPLMLVFVVRCESYLKKFLNKEGSL